MRRETWTPLCWLGHAVARESCHLPAVREEGVKMTDLTYSPAAVSRLLNAVLHPETVEGYERPAARLDAIAAAFVWAAAEEREELILEAAELLTLDPDEGCDNSLSGSLNDAGFGSQGPM
jgi:hypothetical protein